MLPSPFALDSGVTAPFVVQKMFGSLLPSFLRLRASVRIGLCFSSLSNPNKELSRQAERSTSPLQVGQGECWRGQGGREGEEAEQVGGWQAQRE